MEAEVRYYYSLNEESRLLEKLNTFEELNYLGKFYEKTIQYNHPMRENDFYSKEVHTSENKEKLRILKQNDFKLFNNNFGDNIIDIKNVDDLVEKSKVIREININNQDVINVMNYLNKKDKVLSSYNYYSDEYLDKLLDNAVNIIGSTL